MFSGSLRPKTSIGILLSRHIDAAVESITPRFFESISLNESTSYFFASGFILGSLSYTASTFFASNITCESVSTARSAAAVSVDINGLPVPQPNITTLPFSRCLSALPLAFQSQSALL